MPGAQVSLAKVAQAARPGWEITRPAEVDAGLEEICYWQPETVTWSYAVHVAIVEVDRETGRVSIGNYAVAHDCGVVVNPMLVEGQIMGGAAQGLGGILSEAIVYDANGQLLSGSLMDYALPTASDIPAMQILHQHSPSPLNPLGVKGVGEGGAVAPPAAIANAVCDALAPFGIEVNATSRLVPHLPALASQLDFVVALGTTSESSIAPLQELLPASAELIVKTGVLPRELLEIAWDEPDRWTRGTGRLIVHWPGAPELRGVHEDALNRAKRAAGFDV